MRLTSVVMAVALATAFSAAAFAADPSGTWLSESGKTKVRIAPCGGNAWCGTILWVKGPEQNDVNNPDPAKHGKPLVGSLLISDMKPDGDAYKGALYDYTSGKTYTGKLKVTGAKLALSGCVLGGLLCKSESWSKAE